jgi:hypothetical protein
LAYYRPQARRVSFQTLLLYTQTSGLEEAGKEKAQHVHTAKEKKKGKRKTSLAYWFKV